MDDDSEKKKAKGTKKCVIKRRIMFENYKDCLFKNKIILKSQQEFKSDHHDDKRLQTFDKTSTCPHGTYAFKVSKVKCH